MAPSTERREEMITLQVKGVTSDQDFFETWDDLYEYDVDSSTSIEEVVFTFLRQQEWCDSDIDEVKEMLETGKWIGGTWRKVNDNTIEYDTDVTEIVYTISRC